MELDDAYANAAYIPGAEAYPGRWAALAKEWREAQDGAEVDVPYGAGERQRFDLFRPKGAANGVVVFVHGGYWLRFDKSYWSHLAAGAVAQGWVVAMPSYDLCPTVRISVITRQIAAAVEVVASRVAGPIVLAGHSAGGHLVARMLAKGVLSDGVAGRLQRVVSISPVADLRPLLQTSMNADLRLDRAEAEAESPVLTVERHDVPVTVWVGGDERPVFLDQARWLAEAWGAGLMVTQGEHHFNVIEPLAEADSALTRALLA